MKQNKIYTVDDTTFIAWYNECKTYTAILSKFGLLNSGCYHNYVKKRILELGLSVEKFHVSNHTKHNKIDISLVFVKNSTIHRSVVKKRFKKLVPYTCSICSQNDTWKDKNLVLVLDHINGINNDNRVENLRFLCPNCNSQTDTFTGRNTKRIKKRYYCNCGSEINYKSITCKPCSNILRSVPTKIKWPDNDTLSKDLFIRPASHIAKELGCSDTALCDYCRKNKISKPGPGYWRKKKYNSV